MKKALFKNKNFNFLNVSNAVSQFGDWFSHMALISLVNDYSKGSFLALPLMSIFIAMPTILFGPFVGIFIDRWRKKSVMIWGDFIRALLVILVPFLVLFTKNLYAAGPVIFIVFTMSLLFNNAKMSVIPLIVEKEEIMEANSLNTLIARIAMMAGLLTAGWFVNKFGWRWGFWIDSASYFVSLGAILFIKSKNDRGHSELISIDKGIRDVLKRSMEGLKYIFKESVITFVIITALLLTFISGVSYSLVIPIVQRVLNLGTMGISIFWTIAASGLLTGAFLAGSLFKNTNRALIIALGIVMVGLMFFLGAFYPTIVSLVVISFVAGSAMGLVAVTQNTLIHETSKEELMGRTFVNKDVMNSISFLLTGIFTGYMADRFNFRLVLIGAGAFLIVFTVAMTFLLTKKSFKKY